MTVAPTTTRRYPRWHDGVGSAIAGLWPVVITLAILRNPDRYNPYAVFSGLGAKPASALRPLPVTDPNAYATHFALGVRAASLLVHGHLPWWNPFEGLGAPLVGELQSAALFPLTPLLLIHDGVLVFHLVLVALAGVATYWLLREFRCSPLVAAAGGMLYATNGTFAWLANAAVNPVCFLPVMVLGVERARRAARDARGGGWHWLAVGTALALLAGFIETAALGLIFVVVIAVQRTTNLTREQVVAFARKGLAGLAAGMAIAMPVLVAFDSFLSNGYVFQHAGNTADHGLAGSYLAMSVSPYLFGRIDANSFPLIHSLWGAVGGYTGFALLALGVASLFGRRDRALRIVLASWVGLALADSVGLPGLKQLIAVVPVTNHIVLYRYLPPTWELALVILAAFALRDLATSPRTQALIALTSGVLASSIVLLLGISLASGALTASKSIATNSLHQSELLVVAVAAGLLLAVLLPLRYRALGVGAVTVLEAAILFAIPIAAWPTNDRIDRGLAHFLTTEVGSSRFFSLGVPAAGFGTQAGVRQLNVVDLPVPASLVPIVRKLDPHANATLFTGGRRPSPGVPTPAVELLRHLRLYEQLGVAYVVAPRYDHLFSGRPGAHLAYEDRKVQIWKLEAPAPLARAPGCVLRTTGVDAYVASCPRPSKLLRSELVFPGWSASVNGVGTPVRARGPFQSIALPRGRSVVVLGFLPPYMGVATAVSVVGLLVLLVPWEIVAKRRRRHRPKYASWADYAPSGTSLPRRGASDPEPATGVVPALVGEPATGAVPALVDQRDGEPSTSSVPVVAMPSQAQPGGENLDGPPTSAVALETFERPEVADPPTIAVPSQRPAHGDDPR